MNTLSANDTAVIAKQAKELVMAAQLVYPTPQLAAQSFEKTGKNLVDAGAIITGAVFLAAARIINLMLQMDMVEMGNPAPSPTSPDPNAN